jgi:hypothetical protein
MLRRISVAALAVLLAGGLVTAQSEAAPVTLEAESAALSGGAQAESEHAGFTGSGYIGGFVDANRGNATARFTTSGTTPGANDLTLRYANGTGSTRTLTLTVNGSPRQISLPVTAGWTSWGTLRQTVTLNAGTNTLAVTYGSGDNGNVNLDNLTIDQAPASAPGTVEAESTVLSGGARVESEHAGFTGSGYVGGFIDANRGNAAATFSVTVTAGEAEVAVRYANGTGTARTMSLSVNGTARQISLPATSSWSTWETATTLVTVNAGANTIVLSYGSSDNGNVNLDNIKVTPTTPVPPTEPGTYELETGFLAGGATVTTSPSGATGTGSVTGLGAGARVIRSVSQTAAGNATMTLRYRNDSGSARTISLYTNGLKQRQLSLTAGTQWQTTAQSVDLRTGLNIIGFQVDAGDNGGVQLDNLVLSGTAGLATRGATVPYTTYEAESGTTNGSKLTPGRKYTTDVAEASGRSAVKLTGTGQYVQVTLTKPANAITVRASLPDSADGTGTTAPLAVYANDAKITDLSLTSKYAWMYGAYPFNGGPGGERPHRFFDDARTLLPQTYPAGTVLKFAKQTTATDYVTVDLVDAEVTAAARPAPAGYIDVTAHGARPNDGADDANAVRAAITAAQATAVKGVWIPAGTFNLGSLVTFNGVDIRGAGIWHTVLQGANRRGGFAPNGGNTRLTDFTFDGDVTTRDPDTSPNSDAFIDGTFGTGSTIFNVATNHSKVGMWVKGADSLYVAGLRVRNTMADGVNINGTSTNVRVEQSTFRNTGDDAMAMWSWDDANGGTVSRTVFAFNTITLPILANGAAIYGGNDNRIEDSLIADTVFNGGGIMVSTWHASKPFGGTTTLQRNTFTRTGTHNWDWHNHTGAVWLYAERADITGAVALRDLQIDDSSYHGLLFSWQKTISNVTVANVRINGTGSATDVFDYGNGTVTNANSHGMHFQVTGTGRFDNVTVSGVKGTGSQPMTNENGFTIQRGTGNTGW